MKHNYIMVFCTVPDVETAQNISKILVEEKRAACCNIVSPVKSIYFWQAQLQEDQEILLLIKTRQDAYPSLEKRISELHPYSVPEIIALPIIHGNPEYFKWMDNNVE